ncbi:MAG: endonuclease [Fimbriimonadales bacterium]|nr:MAG: endonuclease [Fimbriimonadales bacterium]
MAAFLGPERPLRLWFEDEARLGLHLPRYRRVTARGVRPKQPFQPLYEYYWLYGAVEPKTGESFYLEMPTLDQDCFTVFLAEFGRHYAASINVVVLARAPAHTADSVVVQENVVLLFLPAYSPELNPVERLWLAVRQQIDVFDGAVRTELEALREHVAGIVRSFTKSEVARLTGYNYILDAVRAL